MKKILLSSFFFVFLLFSQSNFVYAANQVDIYFFGGDGCPHCAKEEIFLDQLEEQYPTVSVHRFEVWHNSDNRELLKETAQKLGIEVSGVPFTVIGKRYFVGFSEEITNKKIEEIVKNLLVEEINQTTDSDSLVVSGIDISNLSLPALTIVLGGLDGFNPCAMWTLIFLITLLLGMEDRRRMWILGTTFIVASAAVYFIFMAAWLNLLLFIGLIVWVRIFIGLLALIGGGYNLREYFQNPAGTCKVSEGDRQQKISEKLKRVVKERNFLLALGGIILLAFAVNLVELFCSAGLPAVYTQVLALNNLATWQYYLYLLLYIFVFMLDDLIIFVVAMTALRITGLTSKYTRYSHLIGGILMLLIGLALIFKPEWLLFG